METEHRLEKKDDPKNAKGDHGHEAEAKEAKQHEGAGGHQAGSGRGHDGPHHKRKGGNPDGSE